MTDPQVRRRVHKLRKLLLLHRYLYYVMAKSLATDAQYDDWERELKRLLKANPELRAANCPSGTVGSSRRCDYPLEIAELAERLAAYRPKANFEPFDALLYKD
jgi:NAD-dependent DNA ligase